MKIALDVSVRDAFRVTVKTLLQPRKMLCRFISSDLNLAKDKSIPDPFGRPWWMDWTTAVGMLSSWKNVSATEVVRARIAVTKKMSPKLDSLLQIVLKEPVYAWKGIAIRTMPR